MTVVDASVVVDALVLASPAGGAARRVVGDARIILAPAILKAEVASALRTLERREQISPGRARAALDSATRLPVRAFDIEPFLGRVWELRHNLTTYDAWYIALAERTGRPLHTADRRLAVAAGIRCDIVVV